jgi:Zn-finger nucleic acid-binding protein
MTDLERLVAIEDIRNLQSRYVRYADLKDWQALAGLFLPGASFIPYGMDGAPVATMTGRDEIANTISASVGAGSALHHLFSYEIEIDSPTKARGVWAMEDWLDRTNDNSSTGAIASFKTMHGSGHYHAVYEKVDGAWFIADLKQTRTKLDFTH